MFPKKPDSFPLFWILLPMLWLSVSSCKKEKNAVPNIEILEPTSGQSFEFGDTIQVFATIENADGNGIISVLKGDEQVLFGSQLVSKNGNRFRYELYFNNKFLEGGSYDLVLTAFRGGEKGSDFVKMSLVGLAKKFAGLWLLRSQKIGFLDTFGNYEEQELFADFNQIIYNSKQQTVVAKSSNGKALRGFSYPEATQKYLKSTSDFYAELALSENYIFSFQNDGRIMAYDSLGTQTRNYSLPQNTLVRVADFQNSRLAVGVAEPSLHKLLILNPENGFIVKQVVLAGQPDAMDWISEDKLLIATFANATMKVSTYEFSTNTLTELFERQSEQAFKILKIGTNDVLLATDAQIYRIDPRFAMQPTVLQNFFARDLAWDEVNQEVYYAVDFEILKGSPNATPVSILNFSAPYIPDIEIAYNK